MCFSSFCHHRLAPKWPPRLPFPLLSHVSSFCSSNQSQTCTYLWLFVCRRGQVLMIWPVVIIIPLHRPFVIVEGRGGLRLTTVWDSKGSVLRCNLTASFLGSPLSLPTLLPWLPLQSLLYVFVPKFCPPPPVTQGNIHTCCTNSRTLRHLCRGPVGPQKHVLNTAQSWTLLYLNKALLLTFHIPQGRVVVIGAIPHKLNSQMHFLCPVLTLKYYRVEAFWMGRLKDG